MSILWNFDKFARIMELPFDPLCINENYLIPISDHELLLKAGTPLALGYEEEDTDFTPDTVHPLDEEPSPACFAAEDYHFILTNAQQPKLVKCVMRGYIEKAKVREALEAMGLDIDPTDWAEDLAWVGLYIVSSLGKICQCGGSGGGSSGGGLLVEYDTIQQRLDKTAGEILDVLSSGGSVVVTYDDDTWVPMVQVRQESRHWTFVFDGPGASVTLYAESLDDYPSAPATK